MRDDLAGQRGYTTIILMLVYAIINYLFLCLPATAIQSVLVSPEAEVIDLKGNIARYSSQGDRLEISGAPSPDIIQRFEVPALRNDMKQYWLVFALTNNSNNSLERIIVFPTERAGYLSSLWGKHEPDRIIAVTTDKGAAPTREAANGADVFRVTIDAASTLTFVVEVHGARPSKSEPRLISLWDPNAFSNPGFYNFRKGILASTRPEATDGTSEILDHNSANMTFKLVRAPGGSALAGARFTVLTKDGSALRELFGAYPSLNLPAGQYSVIASRDGGQPP
jgi:hypothetical protein